MTDGVQFHDSKPGQAAQLLLIDDDPVARTILSRQLQQRGFVVKQVSDGPSALATIQTGWPHAIIIDYLMPETDGLEVVRRLRAEAATADLPIILLTALDQPSTIVDAFEQGVDDYVAKPAHPDEVTVRLLRLLRLAERQSRLAVAAVNDGLTGLLNRRGLDQAAARLIREAGEQSRDLACLLFDLDHFKRVNDTYGRAAGDAVLVEAARRFRTCVRTTDFVGRYGGEELAVLLPTAGRPVALAIAERIRSSIQAQPITTPAGPVPVTIRGGIALLSYLPEARWSELLARADAALYQAKQHGRNRIEVSESPVAMARLVVAG